MLEQEFNFEKKISDWLNKLYKEKYPAVIIKDVSKIEKGHDKILIIKGKNWKVEEKARQKVWDDILIETIQDTNSESEGWGRYCDADLLIYVMGDPPEKVYRIIWDAFQYWFEECEFSFKEIESKKGWGNTINKIVPINKIPRRIIKQILD